VGIGGQRRPGRRARAAVLPGCVIGPVLAALPAGRTAVLTVAAAVLVYLVVLAAVALGAAFARTGATRQASARTLDLLLRLIPWYAPKR